MLCTALLQLGVLSSLPDHHLQLAAMVLRTLHSKAKRAFCCSVGSLTFDARPTAWSPRMMYQVRSNSHHSMPWRAELGIPW